MNSLPYRILMSFMRVFFKLLYHQFAWGYDLVSTIVSAGRWRTWVISVLPNLNGPLVLEIGHGPGHLLAELGDRGTRVVGLDESWPMSRLAFLRLVSLELSRLLVNGYAQFLPFRNNTFNTVVSTFPSEYILDTRSLSEVLRVLVPGGKLIILPIAWITGNGLYDRLAAWLFRVTGQTPDWDELYTQHLVSTGFSVCTEHRALISSQLLIVHAEKPKFNVV